MSPPSHRNDRTESTDVTLSARTLFPPWLEKTWTFRLTLYFASLLALSGLAYADRLPEWTHAFPHSDWVAHFLFLGGLGWMLHLAMRRRLWFWIPVGPGVASVWSLADESFQLMSPHRSFSFADMAANFLGIWLVYGLWLLFQKRKRKEEWV